MTYLEPMLLSTLCTDDSDNHSSEIQAGLQLRTFYFYVEKLPLPFRRVFFLLYVILQSSKSIISSRWARVVNILRSFLPRSLTTVIPHGAHKS